LGVAFRDDPARLRTGHGPAGMAVVRRTAVDPLRRAEPAASLQDRRKLAGWSLGHLETLGRQAA
jgi:hypothetical protein